MVESKNKPSIALLLYGYAVALGGLYVFPFWRPFGFNAFPFFTLQDYLSFPLNRAAILIGRGRFSMRRTSSVLSKSIELQPTRVSDQIAGSKIWHLNCIQKSMVGEN